MKVALISDIHSNIFALNAVYADLNKEGIDFILVAGDLIGYYYWPKEVVKLLRNDNRVICIRGNHENILLETLLSKEKAEFYRKKYGSGYDVCHESLSGDDIRWLTALPEYKQLNIDGCTFYMSHGSFQDTNDYLYPDASFERIKQNYSDSNVTIFGHTHYPFIHVHENKIMINPGSVGQPRDIGGLASYAIIDTKNFTTRFKHIAFDHSEIIKTAKSKDTQLEYLWKIMNR
ncbi:metallophosphoesterase family protein [Acinetobacter sp. KS-LM10]|uniref:metallophosphoesterase family protein n=1 Tax=Acinetobacter sp. KS-LM10 TaxID=3120518 RepID=UPI0030D07916